MVVNLSALSSTNADILIRRNLIPDTSYADFALGNSSSKFVAGYFEEGHFDSLEIENIPLSNFIHRKSGSATATTTWVVTGQGNSDSPFTWIQDNTTYSGLPYTLDIMNSRVQNDTSNNNNLIATFLLLSATNLWVYRVNGTSYLHFGSSVRAEEPSSSPETRDQKAKTILKFTWEYIAIY